MTEETFCLDCGELIWLNDEGVACDDEQMSVEHECQP